MRIKQFDTVETLIERTANLLKKHFQVQHNALHAVMLSGGQTPLPVYAKITADPCPVSEKLHILLSDDRMVPRNSSESNLGNITDMLAALKIPETRTLRIDTSTPITGAADAYNRTISGFFENGGKLTLALLGLGIDGHTASLFPGQDLQQNSERFVIAVPRNAGPDRVSVTPRTISSAEKVLFIASSKEKQDIVRAIREDPDSVIAMQATAENLDVELWYTE